MANTKDINEIDLLFNLKNRLKEKKTFTNVGPTLIIVNPFFFIENIYNEKMIEYYIEKHKKEDPDLREKITEPHLYDSVLISIRDLLKNNSKNQALIISGESGAGKTEATKNSMQCITYFFSKFKKENNNNEISLENKILNCNPILEAFGNAKTVRNDNSSRFGKYVKIKLNSKTNIIEGAFMNTYLLEKSRICELNNKERNYHIFYFLLKGCDDNLLNELYLKRDFKYYNYLWHNINEEQIIEVSSINDIQCYNEIINCFKSTNFSDEDIKTILKVVSSVLLLGNIKFKVNNDKCICENEDIFINICNLLNVDKNKLEVSLTKKYLPIQKEFGGLFNEDQIKNYIDALAKDLYNKLFLWIVTKLNRNLDSTTDEKESKYIGLLDIFGFECFDNINSIEQLCINYTNEQLQQLYIKDIFESDKLEFKKENLEDKLYLLDATYKDNKDIIRLIKIFFNRLRDLKEDSQIYDMIKSFENNIKNPPKNDKKFPKIKENKFSVPKFSSLNFSIEHSAKNVTYLSKNFIEKNKDEIKESVIDCLIESKDEIIKMIYTNTTSKEEFEKVKIEILEERKNINNAKITNKYLGMKFCNEMKNLKKELKLCDHHYIRCLKPNEEKKAFLFHSNFVFNQIQYLGILATIQVRKNGFPIRRFYQEFYNNFKFVVNVIFDNNNLIEVSNNIIQEILGKDFNDKKIEEVCLFGKNKIFMKQSFNQLLEIRKNEILDKKINAINIIKCSIHYFKTMQKVYLIQKSIKQIQNFFLVNSSKINFQKKKKKINIIQSLYFTNKQSEIFKKKINNIIFIQNSLRIIKSKQFIHQKKNLFEFLLLRLKFNIYKIKQERRKQIRFVAEKIIEKAKKEILYFEYNKLWFKLNPFFISFLIRKKNKNFIKKAQIFSRKNMIENIIKIFQMNCFFYKIKKKKNKTKQLFNYASTKIFQNYYQNMRKNILIIQKYINTILNKKEIFDKINLVYFPENTRNMEKQNENMTKIFFPHKLENSNNDLKEFHIKKKNQLYINTDLNNIINPLKTNNLTSRNERSLNYTLKNITSIKNQITKNLNNNFQLPTLNSYNPKIKIFAKIIDIDIISDNSENSEYNWSEEFDKIYKKNLENETPIQIINVGNCHSLLINNEGKVFTWGWNNYSQCGDFSYDTNINFIYQNNNNEKIILPVLNYKKNNIDIPLNYNNIIKAILGDDYTILLDKTGSLISFGNNEKGQLGIGNNIKTNYPQFLNKFQNQILDIKSTENFNLFLTKNNEIYFYTFSKNENLTIPKKLLLDKKLKIEKISTGKNFAILLNKNGKCYSLGNNIYNESEQRKEEKNKKSILNIKEIISLSKYNERIIQINCGFKHVVCLSIIGNVYSWGNNSYGQLGRKNSINLNPQIVEIKNENGKKEKIIQISTGFRSSFFLTNKREIYFSGILNQNNCSNLPKKIYLKDNNLEIENEKEFGIVRILCSFNRNFSIFYCSVADVRNLKEKFYNYNKVNDILNCLAEKWNDDKSILYFFIFF